VFYFSKEGGDAVEIAAAGEGARAAERSVKLSGSLTPGRYRVYAFVTERALGRQETRWEQAASGVLTRTRVEIVIVP
jgi:hypothetical protein